MKQMTDEWETSGTDELSGGLLVTQQKPALGQNEIHD